MNIPLKVWIKYRDTLARIDKKAYDEMSAYLERIGGYGGHERDCIEYAYALASKYGEATAALACEMYDAVARASGVDVPPADPAETATYSETAKAIRGTAKRSETMIPQTVSRLSKQAGADTTLKNAARDGAQFAWIPSGDTCAFCITLASRGWQKISKKTLRNGHAEHIHANCDCEYAVSFKGGEEYADLYNPEEYLERYYEASDGSPQDKINAMRREHYALNKERINAMKRIAYARRVIDELNKDGDPIFDIYGPITKSHPDEIERIKKNAIEKGVEIIEGEGRMAYSPGIKAGQPGQLILSDSDSIGAWLHEEQHMLDDEADGFPGFAGLFDIDRRCSMEYNAYRREIELAISAGRNDIAQKLRKLCKQEIKRIGGVWDAKQLE